MTELPRTGVGAAGEDEKGKGNGEGKERAERGAQKNATLRYDPVYKEMSSEQMQL